MNRKYARNINNICVNKYMVYYATKVHIVLNHQLLKTVKKMPT